MNYTPIGRVRPIHRGAHDPSTAYAALDVVRREDGFASYMARRDVPAGTPLADGEYWGLLSDGGLKAVADASCPAFEECGGAAVCHPVAGYPLEVATLIAPKQAGDGEPSPDNIRPISGWTGAKLTRCGKNMLKNTATSQTIDGVTFTVNADGTITANGTATANSYFYIDADASAFKTGAEYSLSGCPGGGSASTYSVGFQYYDSSNTLKFLGNDLGGGSNIPCTEAMKNPQLFIVVRNGVTASNLVFQPMIRLASIADASYEPYQGDTYSADFGQTVYGGTLDWQTGVLTVDRAAYTLNGTEEIETYAGWSVGAYRVYIDLSNAYVKEGIDEYLKCSHTVSQNVHHIATLNANGVALTTLGATINLGAQYTTVDAFRAYLAAQYAAGTPVQVCYKLATPTTIQLSPVQIAALAGTNTLYTDCGDTRAAGRSDMTWVTQGILDRLAALEDAAVSE